MSAVIEDERLYTTTELRSLKLRPKTGEAPAKIEDWRGMGKRGTRHYWRMEQATQVVARDVRPTRLEATTENVLRAIWSVNRAAKRRRDAASTAYCSALHSFAGHHKAEKERYYALKDRGIAWLAHHGHIKATHAHGRLIVWSADGYRFHSTLAPRDSTPEASPGDHLVRIEAKPPGKAEMRLLDATHLLEQLASVVSNYDRVAAPTFAPRSAHDEDEDGDEDICGW